MDADFASLSTGAYTSGGVNALGSLPNTLFGADPPIGMPPGVDKGWAQSHSPDLGTQNSLNVVYGSTLLRVRSPRL